MQRLPGTLIENQAYGNYSTTPVLDLSYGGQQGWATAFPEWINNAALVPTNVIPILLEAPAVFQLLPNPDRWVAGLRSLVERMALRIEGLNGTLTFETADHPVGGAGEIQHEIVDAKQARSEPQFVWMEKPGRSVNRFLRTWMEMGGMHPETKFAGMSTLQNQVTPDGRKLGDRLPDWYSMTMLFIEPCPLHKTVVQSWVITNMFPTTAGDTTGKRDKNSAASLVELSIPFTGLGQYNIGNNVFAQQYLNRLNITNALPTVRGSFYNKLNGNFGISEADVEAADKTGYNKNVTDTMEQAVMSMG